MEKNEVNKPDISNDGVYGLARILEKCEKLKECSDDDKDAIGGVIKEIEEGLTSKNVFDALIKGLQSYNANKKINPYAGIISEASVYYTIGDGKDVLNFLLSKLKEDSNAPVNMALGDMYYYGIDIDKDIDLASKYYQKAILNNETELSIAESLANELLLRAKSYIDGYNEILDISKAIEYLEKAFKLGSIEAALVLGVIYYKGEKVSKDEQKAIEYFEKAAMQGELDAQNRPNFDKFHTAEAFNNLGYAYYKLADYEKAMNCFRTAASLDHPMAFYHVGLMYLNGDGVEKDYDEATKWADSAIELGDNDAFSLLEKIENEKRK